jgi:uncharacterized protein (PEP-CTERM system associated)
MAQGRDTITETMAKAQKGAKQSRQPSARSRGDVAPDLDRFLSMCAAMFILVCCPAGAAKWDIVPTVLVTETYTDNVALAPSALKQGDWVTEITPAISVAATGARLKLHATYDPQILYYARGEQYNEIYQRLDATGSAELAKQLLFLDARANVSQQNVSLQGPLTVSNINTTGNRATVETYAVSPYLRHDFGSEVQTEARYGYSVVNSNDQSTTLADSAGDLIYVRLGSGPAYKLTTWNVDYFRSNVDYKGEPDTFADVILASARRLITPTIGLLAQLGHENYESSGVAGLTTEGGRWSTGVDWTPSPRTSLAATVGERFFGKAYFVDFRHRTRLTTWCAGYAQRVSSTRAEFFVPTSNTNNYVNPLVSSTSSDAAPCQNAVVADNAQSGLPPMTSSPVNFFTNQLFLVKRFETSAAIRGVRNTVTVTVFNDSRSVLDGNVVKSAAGDFAVSNTITQTGTGLLWSLRITAQDFFSVGGTYSRVDYADISRIDDFTYLGTGFTRLFQPRLSGSLGYRWQHGQSNQNAFDYTENAVLATIKMRF